jgi:competence protein ComEC
MNPVKWQWVENPMLPVLFFLAGGIYSGSCFSAEQLFYLSLVFLVGWILVWLILWKKTKVPAILRTALSFFFVWLAGAGLHVFRSESGALPDHLAFHAVITEPGELKENGSRRCLARILRIRKKDGQWANAQGQAVLRFPGQAAAGFRSGHSILASIPLRGIPAPAIPGEFNARSWYRSQGVYWQASVPDTKIRVLKTDSSPSLRQTAVRMRNHMEALFKQHLPQNGDAAMMSALLLGIRRKMDPDLKEAYAAAGLTHILAVSGMHVALIYSFLSLLLGGLRKFRGGRVLFSAAITLLLWFYALLTGLSPSVLRAVCLFSIMQFSDVLRKPSLPVNNLCFASIILLMADQNLLYDLGYQLSFSAVFGILSFQPVLASLWQPKNKVLRLMHENLCVTMAASITTLPLILYHFHRFPVYFLLSNLLAVPFSNLLIYGGIAVLALSPISCLASFTGLLLHYGIVALNYFVTSVNGLPASSIENLYPSVLICLLLIPLIFGIQLWLISRKTKFINLALACLMMVIALCTPLLRTDISPIFYGIRYKKNWLFLKKMESNGWIYKTKSGQEQPDYLQAGFKLSSLEKSLLPVKALPEKETGSRTSYLFRINGKTMLVLNHYLNGRNPAMKLKIDAILLQDAGEKSLIRALEFFSPDEIWLDWNASRCEKLSGKLPDHPLIRNFRDEKLIRIEYSGGKDRKEAVPEFADSKTS